MFSYATARAVGKGDYTGKTKKVTFKIVPKPVKDKKIKVEKKGKNIEVSWKKNGKKLNGYEIQVSTNESFKKDTNKWIGIYDTKKTKFLVTSLEVGKTYYFRVRCYKYVKNGKDTEKFNSEWSETAMIELKQDEFQAHDYINNLKELRSHNFDALYNQYAEKYKI